MSQNAWRHSTVLVWLCVKGGRPTCDLQFVPADLTFEVQTASSLCEVHPTQAGHVHHTLIMDIHVTGCRGERHRHAVRGRGSGRGGTDRVDGREVRLKYKQKRDSKDRDSQLKTYKRMRVIKIYEECRHTTIVIFSQVIQMPLHFVIILKH